MSLKTALPQELIRCKRLGQELEPKAIATLVRGITDGSLVDAQVGALAMAILWRGLTARETAALTLAMRDSGEVLRWGHLPGPVLDKHSTGGIGDKVSLVLAPLIAACGGYVPMISGRGLGHTGGTLDKLESIEGYATAPEPARFRRVVAEAGCAIVGASDALAPADRRLYAIRDVTATVESLPLIVASILSKKLAAGLGALVMDVKQGSGAFLPDADAASSLAAALVEVATEAGLPCRALVTDMSQCLGRTAGHALELREALAMLRGDPVEARFAAVTLRLAAELLELGGLAADRRTALVKLDAALASGTAAERFARMVEGLGGPADLLERPDHYLRRATFERSVLPEQPGIVQAIDARALGLAVITLGGGRTAPGQAIDHAVGLSDVAGVGDAVGPAPLAVLHARDETGAAAAADHVRGAYIIGPAPAAAAPLIAVPGRPRPG